MASVIRLAAGTRLAPETRVVKAKEYQILQGSETMLKDAMKRSRELTIETERQFNAEKKRGYDEGFAEGKQQATQEMLESVASANRYFTKVESQIADIVIDSVRKILGEVDDQALALKLVKQTLLSVRNQHQAILIVHPSQCDSVKHHIVDMVDSIVGLDFVEVRADHAVEVNSCRVETDMGVINASLDSQLQAMEKALKNQLSC